METVIRRLIVAILLCFCSAASATNLDVKEIRLQGIGGYSQNRFTVAIHNDGTVRYTGVSFVAVEGKQQSRISAEDFRKLVGKIDQIHFFKLENRYNDYPLDKPSEVSAKGEVTVEKTVVTDQRTEIVTVVTSHATKSVDDYMGAPKGLFELEQLILDLTHARKWTGDTYDRDVPYYDRFPLNMQVTYRGLLQHYRRSDDPKSISGYSFWFINNKGIDFDVQLQRQIDLQKFDGYLVDATGEIKRKPNMGYKFVLTEIRPVRRLLGEKALRY
jgi:hypothetical protein